MAHARPIKDRMLEKIDKVESGCWEWTSALDSHGYAVISKNNIKRFAPFGIKHRKFLYNDHQYDPHLRAGYPPRVTGLHHRAQPRGLGRDRAVHSQRVHDPQDAPLRRRRSRYGIAGSEHCRPAYLAQYLAAIDCHHPPGDGRSLDDPG